MSTDATTYEKTTPIRALVTGAVAGTAGTLAMDLLWYRRYKHNGGEDGFLEWEFSSGTANYEQAAAPAQVGKRLVEGYLQTELSPQITVSGERLIPTSLGRSNAAFSAFLTTA